MLTYGKACALAAAIRREVDPSVIKVEAAQMSHGATFCVRVELIYYNRVQRLGTLSEWRSLQVAWDMLLSEGVAG